MTTEQIIISIIVPAGIAFLIAWYFRFHTKPEYEIVYDENRLESLKVIFNQIERFDDYFKSFYEVVEKDMGILSDDKKEMVPSAFARLDETPKFTFNEVMKLEDKFKEVRLRIQDFVEQMLTIQKQFHDDFTINLNYVHVSFLNDIARYYRDSLYWCNLVLKNQPTSNILKFRMDMAKKIIKYIKNKKLQKDVILVTNFIDKWENRLSELKKNKV